MITGIPCKHIHAAHFEIHEQPFKAAKSPHNTPKKVNLGTFRSCGSKVMFRDTFKAPNIWDMFDRMVMDLLESTFCFSKGSCGCCLPPSATKDGRIWVESIWSLLVLRNGKSMAKAHALSEYVHQRYVYIYIHIVSVYVYIYYDNDPILNLRATLCVLRSEETVRINISCHCWHLDEFPVQNWWGSCMFKGIYHRPHVPPSTLSSLKGLF